MYLTNLGTIFSSLPGKFGCLSGSGKNANRYKGCFIFYDVLKVFYASLNIKLAEKGVSPCATLT